MNSIDPSTVTSGASRPALRLLERPQRPARVAAPVTPDWRERLGRWVARVGLSR